MSTQDADHGEEKDVSSLEVDHDLTLGRTQETQNSQFWGGRYISYDLTLSNWQQLNNTVER